MPQQKERNIARKDLRLSPQSDRRRNQSSRAATTSWLFGVISGRLGHCLIWQLRAPRSRRGLGECWKLGFATLQQLLRPFSFEGHCPTVVPLVLHLSFFTHPLAFRRLIDFRSFRPVPSIAEREYSNGRRKQQKSIKVGQGVPRTGIKSTTKQRRIPTKPNRTHARAPFGFGVRRMGYVNSMRLTCADSASEACRNKRPRLTSKAPLVFSRRSHIRTCNPSCLQPAVARLNVSPKPIHARSRVSALLIASRG